MSPLRFGRTHGHPSVQLENEHLRVTVLPEKGGDIYELIHVASGVDCLLKTPAGLQPPQGPQSDFLANYEGGWQELFPNANAACTYRGRAVPFHGEAALRAWRVETLQEGAAPAVRLSADLQVLPFRLTKTLQLSATEPLLEVVCTVENLGAEPLHFVGGQHIVLGAPFLEAGCRCEIAGGVVITGDVIFEPATAILAPGQRGAWPFARNRAGQSVDLRHVPGPDAHTHDDLFVTDLPAGRVRVSNARLGLTVDLAWDAAFYRYLTLWTPYGGSDAPPLTGIYGLGIEPFVSRWPLAGAVAAGEARLLQPGACEQTALRFRFGSSAEQAAATW